MEKDNSNVRIVLLSVLILVLLAVCIYLIFFWKKEESITYHMEKSRVFATCVESEYDYCDFFDKSGDIYFSYPIIDSKKEVLGSINSQMIADVEHYIKTIEEAATKEGIADSPCAKIKISKNNYIYNDSHLDTLQFEVIESDRYLSVIEYDAVLSTCASGWTDVTNVYIYDKLEDKSIPQDDLSLTDVDNLKEIAFKNRLNDLADENTFNSEFKTILDEHLYFLYYGEDGNLIVVFSEPETNGALAKFSYANNSWSKNIIEE